MAEQLEITFDLEPWAIIYTTWRSRKLLRGQSVEAYWAERGAYYAVFRLPPGSAYKDALTAYIDAGHRVGHSCAGPFEIHGPDGLYWHKKGLRNLGLCKPEQVQFSSWDELERDPGAASNPFTEAVEKRRSGEAGHA